MKSNNSSFIAGALLGALAGGVIIANNAKAEDGWPDQPEIVGGPRFGMPGFPPYQKGVELSGGGQYFFKTPEALRLYKSGYPPAKLNEEGKLFVLEPESKVITLEPFAGWEGRVHDSKLGDGYLVGSGF